MNAKELKKILKAAGLSQVELGRHLGVTSRTVSRWATGRWPVPEYAAAYLGLLDQYSVTRERIRQIEAKALRKL